MTKVQLFRPPLNEWYDKKSSFKDLESFPIGLAILAKKIRENNQVQIIDGLHSSIEDVIEKIDADVVGITAMYSNYEQGLDILKSAKKKGAITLIGGPYVNPIARRIISNNEFVDYAVVGDGEESLSMLLSGVAEDDVPNLVHRDKTQRIIENKRKNAALDTIFDFENMVVMENYGSVDSKKTAVLSSIRGCIKAEMKNRCSYCSVDHSLKVMNPELVWTQIRTLYEKHGFFRFIESGDTFIVGNYPKHLLEARPKDLSHIIFKRVYAIPNQISEDVIEIFKRLNVEEVYLGIESINNNVLSKANKNTKEEDAKKAISLLKKSDFTIHLPIMYGLSGETDETAEESYRFAESVAKSYSKLRIFSGFAIPLPGTAIFSSLVNNNQSRGEYNGNLEKDDKFDYLSLVKLQLKYNTCIDFEQTKERIEKTRNLAINRESTSFCINEEPL